MPVNEKDVALLHLEATALVILEVELRSVA
jgi:hypothetical protein